MTDTQRVPPTPLSSHKPNSRITITTILTSNTLHVSCTHSILCTESQGMHSFMNGFLCTLHVHEIHLYYSIWVFFYCTFLFLLLYRFPLHEKYYNLFILLLVDFGLFWGFCSYDVRKSCENFQVRKKILYVLWLDYQEHLVDPLGLLDSIDISTFVLTGLFCNTVSYRKPVVMLLTCPQKCKLILSERDKTELHSTKRMIPGSIL